MCLEFGNNFRAACEPIARNWHKRNDPIQGRPMIVVDADLQEIRAISLFGEYLPAPLTVSAE